MTNKIILLTWLGNALIFLGTIIVANKKPIIGFFIRLCADIIFFIYGYMSIQKSFCIFSLLFMFVEINGIIKWNKNEINTN